MNNENLKKEVLDFLRAESVMSAAINNSERPVSTVLLFAVDDDFTFYFTTRRNTVKVKSLAADKKISLSVWHLGKMLVQASGEVGEITDERQIDEILDKLARSAGALSGFWPPVLQIRGSDYAAYSIKTNWLRVLDLRVKYVHSDELFTQII